MNKITHLDILNAIQFATSNQEIFREINRRDEDRNLDCNNINCKIISGIGNPIKLFEVIFNYAFVQGPDRRGEDIVVHVESNRDALRIREWHNQ